SATLGGSATPMPVRVQVRSSRKGLVIAAGAAALVVGGIFVLTRGSRGEERPVAETQRPAPVAPAAIESATPEATTIEITLKTEPESAKLFLDGSELANPYTATVPRNGETVHRVRAKADGYIEVEQDLVFDRGRVVVLTLREQPESGRKPVAGRRGGAPVRPGPAAANPTPTQPAAAAQDPNMPTVRKPIRTLDSDNPFAPQKP
ncbi:MAG TPA: hypothetical protein VF103_05950, partial [Polyangiaceae bacterium]